MNLATNLIVSNAGPRRSGSYALHAVCDVSDPPLLGHNHRSEVQLGRPVLGERWYGVSLYIPSDWSEDDTPDGSAYRHKIIAQWHHENWLQPDHPVQQPLELVVVDSTIQWFHQYGAIGVDLIGTDTLWSDALAAYKGVWTDWVIHANWTQDANTRVIEIWKNGTKIVDWRGTTSHPNGGGVYFRAGLTYDMAQTRDVWVDQIRMAGPSGGYSAVVPR